MKHKSSQKYNNQNQASKDKHLDIFLKFNKTRRENILFKHYIKKQRITYFSGFVFEEDFKIKEILKYQYNRLKFENCIFYKNADFSDFNFEKQIVFLNCSFLADISFSNSNINSDLTIENTYFVKSILNNKIFKDTYVKAQNLKLSQNINLPRLDGILLSKKTRIFLKDCHYTKDYYYIGKINYTIAQIQAEILHDYKNMGYYIYYERKYNTINKGDFKSYSEYLISKLLNCLAREVMGYGENLGKFFIYIILMISAFAFFYMIIGATTMSNEVLKLDLKNINTYSIYNIIKIYIEFWYFSVVTFSTVGFGDIVINGIIGKILVCLEVFIGITIQSTWAALIIKRMFR